MEHDVHNSTWVAPELLNKDAVLQRKDVSWREKVILRCSTFLLQDFPRPFHVLHHQVPVAEGTCLDHKSVCPESDSIAATFGT